MHRLKLEVAACAAGGCVHSSADPAMARHAAAAIAARSRDAFCDQAWGTGLPPSAAGLSRRTETPCFAAPPHDGCAFVGSAPARARFFFVNSVGGPRARAKAGPPGWTN